MSLFYCRLTRQAVRNFLLNGDVMSLPDDLPPELLNKRCVVFVSIENNGRLRGCIGTYLPTKENIAQEIIDNAITAAACDNRFQAITLGELDQLTFSIYLLSPPEKINGIDELDPKKYGVLVKSVDDPSKSGLLLPDLEGIDTAEQQFAIACQKAGIDPTRERVQLFRFDAERFNE